MVELALPRNSKIKKGKVWNKPSGAEKKTAKEFKVYRWSPDDNENPRVDTYYVDTSDCGPMVLDGIIKIKNEIAPMINTTNKYLLALRLGVMCNSPDLYSIILPLRSFMYSLCSI